jgi:GNAT superfamily N-acetyltransferase/ABC-type transport system involved in cytochrome c biogenesis ATPase subunit
MTKVLSTTVDMDDALNEACKPFDYTFTGTSEFVLPKFDAPKRDGSWSIGLIVGASGSGKTQLLKEHYGITPEPEWLQNKAIVSQLGSQAIERLSSVGLNSVPSWCKPYHVLSNGEQFRARMARLLDSNTSFDEFTSVVDRTVAKSASVAIQRYIRQQDMKGVVFATCHRDIIEWLQPDWVYDTLDESCMPRGCLCPRPSITIDIQPCSKEYWQIFKKHHYLSGDLNNASRCFLGTWNNEPIVFGAAITMPSGSLKNAWRGHRTVVLPDYQGLGIGVRFSDAIAQMFVDNGHRYFSRTAHPRMGSYRMLSPLWKPTSKNKVRRVDYEKRRARGIPTYNNYVIDPKRNCFSHEYVGIKNL